MFFVLILYKSKANKERGNYIYMNKQNSNKLNLTFPNIDETFLDDDTIEWLASSTIEEAPPIETPPVDNEFLMNDHETSLYFTATEKHKIDAFIMIPKMLFRHDQYKSLSNTARLIYSLYLNRYTITTYKDREKRPYIIYNDKDIQQQLKISRATCSRCRKELLEVNLIDTNRGTGNNKIYILNYRNPDSTEFYTKEDLADFSFYRFPFDFLTEKFNSLSLNAKLIYTIYFDYMCMSQMHYIVDVHERIYFLESVETQCELLGMSAATLKNARTQLIVAGLLIEYKDFNSVYRFYLLKLQNYNGNFLSRYNDYSKEEQKDILKRMKIKSKEKITKKITNGRYIKSLRNTLHLKSKEILQQIDEDLKIKIDPASYSKMESGKREMPLRVYNYLKKYLEEAIELDTNLQNWNNENKEIGHKSTNMIPPDNIKLPQNQNIDTTSLPSSGHEIEKTIPTKLEICYKPNPNIDTDINKTSFNNNSFNNTSNNYINNINKLINSITNKITSLEKFDYELICAALNKIQERQNNNSIETNEYISLFNLLNSYTEEQLKRYFTTLIDRMKSAKYKYRFKTEAHIINCFITYLLNDLKKGEKEIEKYIKEPAPWARLWIKSSLEETEEEYDPSKVSNYEWWNDLNINE